MARTWRCQKVSKGVRCGTDNPRVKQRCATCGGPRPAVRKPAHRAILDSMPYEAWEVRYGALCNLCGAARSQKQRLCRDHDHKTGAPRGLLCVKCNRALPAWVTPQWLRRAAEYIEQSQRQHERQGA